MLVESVKDLNKLNYNGVDVDVFQLEDQDPLFRSNGYDVNGDKLPFPLGFDAVNSEYINLGENYKPFTTWGNVDIEIPIYIDTNNSSDTFFGVWHYGSRLAQPSTEQNKLRVNARKDIGSISLNLQKNGSTIFGSSISSKYTNGIFETVLKIKNGLIYYDNVLHEDLSSFNNEDLTPLFTSFFINRIGVAVNNASINQYYNGILKPFLFNNETFHLTVGLGNTITGSNGTIATINTSAAQAKDRINFGVHLKGNDVDGFTPYVKD